MAPVILSNRRRKDRGETLTQLIFAAAENRNGDSTLNQAHC